MPPPGATVIGVAADISRADDVDRIVAEAVAAFGAIDTWINAAAALVVGELHDQPADDIEQLVATNVLGTALASRAAMIHFRSRGAGVLINLSSLLGVVPNPVVPTYSMSKFAVRGLTLSLHQSTWRRSPIRVCTVLPGPIDTPMFDRAVESVRTSDPSDPAGLLRRTRGGGGHSIRSTTTAAAYDRPHRRTDHDRHARSPTLHRNGRRPGRRARLIFRDNITGSSAHRAPSAITGAVGGGWRRNPVRVSTQVTQSAGPSPDVGTANAMHRRDRDRCRAQRLGRGESSGRRRVGRRRPRRQRRLRRCGALGGSHGARVRQRPVQRVLLRSPQLRR